MSLLARQHHAILAVLAVCLPNAHGDAPQNGERPNILWLTAEDMSPNLGCYGDPDARSPNLDRLAAEGVRYTRAFSHAGVCAPARSGLITGMYPSSLGTQHMRSTVPPPHWLKPLPAYLRSVGYYCSNSGKTDYNFPVPEGAWDKSNRGAHWRNRQPGQPFFSVFNANQTHESFLRSEFDKTAIDPADVSLPKWLPDAPAVRREWARYLDLVTEMDAEHGARLKELAADGLAEDTIVFFFSDHGVGLPRAKQFVFEAGLHVPLIVYFPPKWRHLAPATPGEAVDRLVSFVDFAPTVLSLAGVPVPEHMQGTAFLGKQACEPRRYVYAIRDRMDERYDINRTVRDERFKYHRNYMPYLPHFPWLDYMELLETSRAWRRLSGEGKLNGALADFLAPTKPAEQLFDLKNDPHELHDRANDPAYREHLLRLRQAHLEWVTQTRDTGLLPEQEMLDRAVAAGASVYEMAQSDAYPQARILETAWLGDAGDASAAELRKRLGDDDAAVRFWAAAGLMRLADNSFETIAALKQLLSDHSPEVRIIAAEAIGRAGQPADALPVLAQHLADDRLPIRLAAANVVDRLDEAARPLVPAIQAARQQPRDERLNVLFVWCVEKALRDLGELGTGKHQ